MSRLIATLFGIGHLRPAPGTWGSLSALPLALGLHVAGGPLALGLALVAVLVLGLWASAAEISVSGEGDPQHVVIDEVAGQWVALLPVSIGAAHAGAAVTALWPGWIAAFVLFRLFDIWKPGPVGWADRRGGALGLMLDDVIAGVFAGLGVMVLAGIAHGLMGA